MYLAVEKEETVGVFFNMILYIYIYTYVCMFDLGLPSKFVVDNET